MSESEFYADVIARLLENGTLSRELKVLVVCGAHHDRDVLQNAGFGNVTLSNLYINPNVELYRPYFWSTQNVEGLTYKDEEFDFVIAHDGLHHCQSPHRGMLEMYRVARKGILVFEPPDNLPTRLACWLKLGQVYEMEAVASTAYVAGGCNNTMIPNHIYRWTSREVRAAVDSYAPWGRHRFQFFHGFGGSWEQWERRAGRWGGLIVKALRPVVRMFFRLFPALGNRFAFVVLKPRIPEDLHPWVLQSNGRLELNRPWAEARFGSPPAPKPAEGGPAVQGRAMFVDLVEERFPDLPTRAVRGMARGTSRAGTSSQSPTSTSAGPAAAPGSPGRSGSIPRRGGRPR